ncbi:MAG: hypothetical protein AAGL24_16600 [Pseudomonadota bacterium]
MRRVQEFKTLFVQALAGFVFVVAVSVANPAKAVTVDVRGVAYDVTTIFGTYENLFPTLEQQVWFGNQGLATEFAATVGNQLGGVNGNIGPFFVYGERTLGPGGLVVSHFVFTGVTSPGGIPPASNFAFGIASPVTTVVPLPAPALLLLTAFAAIAAVRGLRA